MLKPLRWLLVAALLPASLAAGFAAPARPADARLLIGVLDYQKLQEDAVPVVRGVKEVQDLQETLNKRLEALKDTEFLTEQEFNELAGLVELAQMNGAQAARQQALKDLNQQRYKEWLAIQTKQDATPEEKKKAEAWDKGRLARMEALKLLQTNYLKQVQEKAKATFEPLRKKVETAIDQVGKEKGLYIILTKKLMQGDEDLVFWGGEDITADVVKVVNKMK